MTETDFGFRAEVVGHLVAAKVRTGRLQGRAPYNIALSAAKDS
jgi:hypothetical protein